MTQLLLNDRSLVVFVDDTGHERLVKDHPVYGLGGCAIMASDLDRIVRQPWREVRKFVKGSENEPLHACKFWRRATEKQKKVVSSFFTYPFFRFGAILSINTQYSQDIEIIEIIAKTLQSRIRDIAKWTRFEELHVIFESSERANDLIQKEMQDFGLQEDGKSIPIECYFMSKSACDPALEVADFVMYAVQRQARRKLGFKESGRNNFSSVFHSVDRRLVSYMDIDKVSLSGSQNNLANHNAA